jgi:catecholate siderophore receptor
MISRNDSVRRPRSMREDEGDNGALRLKAGATLGLSVAMLMPAAALAQAQQADQAPLATVTVEDTAIDPNPNAQVGVPYKARTSGDDRHTRPLAETPQTITVLTRKQIEDSGYTDLIRILDAQPGVTVGTGENGNAFGDRYIIRGQEARSDVFVDGLRDPGMSTRESFAIEQLEISKGPNSTFAGRGTSGGAINAITKAATTDYNFTKGSIGLGNDRNVRATADVNYSTGNSFAVRANVLYGYQEIPDRGPADRERKGIAISALYSPTDNLSVILDYYGLRAKDNPDLGDFLLTTDGVRRPYETPPYAQKEDFLKSHIDTFTGRVKYTFSPDIYFTNIARYGKTNNSYFTTGAASAVTSTTNPTGSYQTSRLDTGHQGWQGVRYFADQANLHFNSELLGGKNELIIGAEYTNHKVDSGTFASVAAGAFNCRTTAGAGALNSWCLTDANGQPVANINNLAQRTITRNPYASRKWAVETISGTIMDTVDLTPALTLFAGGRLDHYKFTLGTFSATTGLRPANAPADYRYSDTLWNGHLGLTWKAAHGLIFYASAATAADINGGEADSGTSAGYGGLILINGEAAPAKPERSVNFEIGTKWNVLNEKLLLTAALFQSTKSDVMEGADYASAGTFNSGKNRVRGIEISAAGNVTDAWSVQGGVTVMDTEVLKSFTAANVGKTLANVAKFQAEFQTRYQITDQFAMGAAVKHKSKRYGGQPDTAAPFAVTATGFTYSQPVPAYTVGDLFAEYKFNENIDLRLNVNNVTNKQYYLAVYRAGFFLYKGDARQIVGTLNFNF